MLLAIVAFVGILVLLVIVHELGHFITAKASGVKVDEFGIGFPPRLVGVRRGETLYSLNLIPLGGFVKMAGEEDPQVPGSLASKSIGTRFLVLSAGSLMNLLLPIVLLSVSLMIPHNVVVGQVQVDKVEEGSPAQLAGIEPGDIILEMNNQPVRNLGELQYEIQLRLGATVPVLLDREGSLERVELVPRWRPPEGQGATGITVSMINGEVISESYPFWEAIPTGARSCVDTLILFKNEITKWFVGGASIQLAGPIGIAQLTGEVVRGGLSPVLQFAAFLSINLAIINLLPLPALDGGRLVFVFLEWVRRGKRISPKKEGLVHLIGFALIMTVFVIVSYFDITRIIHGETLFP